MDAIRLPLGHRVIALAFAGIATVALGCGDGERDSGSSGLPRPTMIVPPVIDSAGWSHLAMSADSFCVDAVPSIHCRAFRIGGGAYTITAEGHAENFHQSYENLPEGVRQVRIYDDSARVVYQEAFRSPFADSTTERLRFMMQPDNLAEPTNWVDVEVTGLEDAAGLAQAFLITYSAYVRRGTVPDVYQRIVAPRAGKLQALVPKFTHYGDLAALREGSRRGAKRLLDGNRLIVREWRNYFSASVPYHVDFGCKPGTATCLTLALPDSIAGLARFDVDAQEHMRVNYEFTAELDFDNATVDLFAAPGAEKRERVRLGSREIKVLGGAGRVRFGGAGIDGTPGDLTKDDWLHIQLPSGRSGWIHGHDDFTAIGLIRAERTPPGSEPPEPPPRTEMNEL